MSSVPFRRMIGLLVLLPVLASAQTPPEAFLGHRVGEDRKLADADQVLEYFRLLDRESAKLDLVTIGETAGRRPLVMAVISAEANLAGIDAVRETAKRLRDPRGLSPEDARALARDGKVLLLVAGSDEFVASVARRTFRNGDEMEVALEIYGLTVDAGRRNSLRAEFAFLQEGKALLDLPAYEPAPSAETDCLLAHSLRLRNFRPGEYVLRITIIDGNSGRSLVRETAFLIED